jgi:hypothetical protein
MIDTVVKHTKGRRRETLIPLRISIKKGIISLISALTFEYPKFNLSKHECGQINALVGGLADKGRLLRGRAREMLQWIGVNLIKKTSRC